MTLQVRRKKKTDLKKTQEKLWELCKAITRRKFALGRGWQCYTCRKPIDEPAKAHTGHFIPSAACGAFLRYDLRNLRVQCYFCNINLGGNGTAFYRRLVEDEGQEYVDQLFRDKQKIVKADIWFYQNLVDEYQVIFDSMTTV
jgi:hypothetical protein